MLFLLFTILSSVCLATEELQLFYKSHLKPGATDGFDQTGLVILSSGALAGIVAHRYDEEVKDYFNEKRRVDKSLTEFGNSLGSRYLNVAIAGIQMIWDRSNGLAHLEALLGSTLQVAFMKNTIHRTRPNGENENSFPSGHTSGAFASAGSLSYAYGAKAAIPSYLFATTTMLARLQDNKHWLSDVVVATSIGVYWARSSGLHHGYLSPIILNDGGGFSYNFPISY